jgi:hypothetical protein
LKERKILTVPLRLCLALLIIGAMFKIMHWPFSDLIICTSLTAIPVLYSFRYIHKQKKSFDDHLTLVLVIFWCANAAITIEHLPGRLLSQSLTSICMVVWLVRKTYTYIQDPERSKSNSVAQLLFWCAAALLILGIAFKLVHWPGGGILLGCGFLCGILWLFADQTKNGD